MKKIRWTLALLALGIGLPALLIIQRAVASLELENVVRHEAVAERVFDEMERSLSDFLLREESRPPSDYASSGLSSTLPPVFASSAEPFVLGWFVVEPDGERRTFLRASSAEARVAAGFREGRVAPTAQGAEEALAEELAEAEVDVPAPGRTKSLDKNRLGRRDLAQAPDAKKESAESSAYDVLQSLNRAGSLRDERQSKAKRTSPAPSDRARARSQDERSSWLGSLRSGVLSSAPDESTSKDSAGGMAEAAAPQAGLADSAAPAEAEADDSDSLGALGYADFGLRRGSASAEAEPSRAETGGKPAPAVVAVPERLSNTPAPPPAAPIVDPLIGRMSASGDVVLDALIAWLEERVLAETGLARLARIAFFAPDSGSQDIPSLGPSSAGEYRYLHRFAEPFDALLARLDLSELPGLGGAMPIYALAALLTLVATIGLFAVDRMTRVVVEYANRRSDFVAAVSHELKTPLTSIRMYGEMLRDGLVASEEKREEYYSTITDESERLSRLIDNVLEFSRLEQNRRELSLVVGGLPEAIRAAAEKLRAHVDREGFRLSLDLEEGLPPVQYDRDAVTQLVFNLVDNALKYARHADTREIEIRLHREDDRIALCVRDFGPGVAEDQLRRIFEPFYRIGEEMTRTSEGTGIGLALVKELSESMGAMVSSRNAEGGGLEVRIAFATSG